MRGSTCDLDAIILSAGFGRKTHYRHRPFYHATSEPRFLTSAKFAHEIVVCATLVPVSAKVGRRTDPDGDATVRFLIRVRTCDDWLTES